MITNHHGEVTNRMPMPVNAANRILFLFSPMVSPIRMAVRKINQLIAG
jgi:hypothetical protein